MNDTPTPRRSRSRVAERAQHLYMARTDDFEQEQYAPAQAEEPVSAAPYAAAQPTYMPNEEPVSFANYMPNEAQRSYAGYTPNTQADAYAGYTPNEGVNPYAGYTPNEPPAEPVFAPVPMPEREEPAVAAANVYRPREVTWVEEDREEVIAESELGYQVQQEEEPAQPPRKRKKRRVSPLVIILPLVVVLVCAGWLLREPLMQMLGVTSVNSTATDEPVAPVVTPEPVKAYDSAPAAAVADNTRRVIAELCGTMEIENYIVTEDHIVARNQRKDGTYDFYLFTAAEGRLLCYFEGLEALEMIPQAFGGFYVKQSPWLVTANGSALIRTADIEAALNESVFLHPMYGGWAVVESTADGHANYVNEKGELLSSLWFSRTFPFTGDHTIAYVDTGSTAAADDRYLLYVIGQDGTMTRWLAAGDMQDAVGAACGMAYMSNGDVYRLPDTTEPVATTSEITVYADCDAVVIRDEQTGKYGLFVHGEQHYDFVYDAIHPLESDITWAEKKLAADGAVMTVKAVSGASYPQPLSYSFVLEREGGMEYVALSTTSSYPIRLDGEF